ncbi:MAG TPA: helix-turn-helix transcriptional regulator [Pseudonocardiaceae bacterium]
MPRLRALAAGLRRAREDAGLSTRELAARLSWSQGQVSHFENSRRAPTPEQVAMIAMASGVNAKERARLIQLAKRLDEPNWLTTGVPGVSLQLAGAVECEIAATATTEWAPHVLPGLLQRPEYAEAILRIAPNAGDLDLDALLTVRMGLQQVITRYQDPVRLSALIGESALYEPIVSPVLMADQLRHLADMARLPNVHVRIVPDRIGCHPGLAGPFVLYEFADAPPILHFEHFSSGAFVPDADNVGDYRYAIETLTGLARSAGDSAEMVASALKEWEGKQ